MWGTKLKTFCLSLSLIYFWWMCWFLYYFQVFHLPMSYPGDESKRFQCPECGRTYASQAGIGEHIKTHQGVYRCRCPECHKGFTSNKTMKEHLTSHTNINYFKCDYCGQDFRYHYKMRRHMKTECRGQQQQQLAGNSIEIPDDTILMQCSVLGNQALWCAIMSALYLEIYEFFSQWYRLFQCSLCRTQCKDKM